MKRKEFAPLSFWAWNETMDDKSICRRIEEFHEQGLHGFFMHSRAGLMTPYLSDEWFRACRTAAKKAEELGMEAWIYDEDGWPSGFAGGLVNGCGREYQAKYIKVCKKDDEVGDACVLAAFSKKNGTYRRTAAEQADVRFVCVTEPNYVDLLSKKVTEKFIEATHERYKAELGALFGTTVPGFFSDEPQYDLHGFPYSDELEEYFQRRNGYSFIESMYLFLEPDSPETQKYRKDYWDTVQEMMERHFARQIYDWCEANHVKFTGHFPGEDSYIQQMQSTAGVMPKYRYMQQPGIDHLGRFETEVNRFFYPVEPETVYILGDFSVSPETEPVYRPGYIKLEQSNFVLRDRKEIKGFQDVTSQGCWFYRGSLRTVFDIEKKENCRQYLKFCGINAAAVLVRCNGQSELLYMSPFRAELTKMLEEGQNQVEVLLYGTNRNLLGPHHHCKGEVCFVGPNTFKGVRGYEDNVVSPDIDFEDTWTDAYSFQPFGVEKIMLETVHFCDITDG